MQSIAPVAGITRNTTLFQWYTIEYDKRTLLALSEAPPRTRMVLPAEAEPLFDMICTPETLPLINCSGDDTNPLLKTLELTIAKESVM